MYEINKISEISLNSIINVDENSDIIKNNKEDILNDQIFKVLFSIKFEEKNINSDNESQMDYNDYYYINKKIVDNNDKNIINSNDNSDDTKGKSNDESPKIEEKKIFSECTIIQSELFDSKKNNINNFPHNFYQTVLAHNNINNINFNYIISTNNKTIVKEKKNFLRKKRKIFNVIYSDNLNIFTSSDYNNNIRKMINDTLNDINFNNNKKEYLEIKKKRNKKKKFFSKRKQSSDNIRKKIKVRFLKTLKNTINEKLKNAGSQYIFTYLPQIFIINSSKELNKSILDLSLKELFSKNFYNNNKGKNSDLQKYNHNLFVLKYLENHHGVLVTIM